MIITTLFALTLAVGPVVPADAGTLPGASTPPAAQYEAWLGCWDLENGRFAGGTRPRLCVMPREGGGVRLLTISNGDIVSDEALIVDDVARPTTAPGCRGTERAAWATTLPAIFRTADLTCGADTAPRSVSSMAFLRADGAWIDVQVVGSGEKSGIRVRRYQLSDDQSVPAGAGAGDRAPRTLPAVRVPGWTAANVIEASAKLPTEGVEAVVTELDRPVELKKKQLVALADGGVHERVIDLLVGLTYPEKFVVRRSGGGGGGSDFGLWSGGCEPLDLSQAGPCLPAGWDRLGVRGYYSAFGFPDYYAFYGYGSPFGYYGYGGMYGGYDPYYHGGYAPGGPSTPTTPGRPVRSGFVVNGQGYTSVSVRQPTTFTGPNGSRGSSGDASNGGANSSSSGPNSSAGVSSQGYSSGGAGGGDRTAVARPPQ